MKLERYCKGLADLNRLRILNLLQHGELCGCDVQYVLGAAQPNVSRHLIYLKNAGLVLDRREGFRIYYRLATPQPVLAKPLFDFLRAAFKNEILFRQDTQKLKKAIEDGACTVSEWHPYSAIKNKTASARR